MSITEPIADDHNDSPDVDEDASWDAFWAEVQRQEADERTGPATQTIRGVTVTVPHDLPLLFERQVDQLKSSGDEQAFAALLATLFGADVLDAWTEAGMTAREFQVVLTWGMAHGKGHPISFRDAYELASEADGPGKATPARTNARSGGSGGRSKRTSAANTSSRRKR